MSVLTEGFRWLNDPLNWRGSSGVPYLLVEHLSISALAVLIGALIGLPLALFLGHTGRGGGFTVVLTNVSRAVPTLALLTIFAVTPIGFGNRATTIALALFAIPPLLTNTYVGIRGVDRDIVEAARGMGLSERDVLTKVELPLALPLIAAGFRTAAVQVVATATLAALVGGGGLGRIISDGFATLDQGQILAGGVLVALLALITEGLLALVQRSVTPGRVRRSRRRARALTASRSAGAGGDAGGDAGTEAHVREDAGAAGVRR